MGTGRRVQVVCAQCNKIFDKYIGHVNASKTGLFYCSHQCSGLAQQVLVKWTCQQCGKQSEAAPSKVQKFCCRRCNIQWQHDHDPERKRRLIERGQALSKSPPLEILIALYQEQDLSPTQIGERFGVQPHTIRNWLHQYGIPVRPDHVATRFQAGLTPTNKKPIPDKETLCYLYSDWKMTTTQIGEHYQVSGITVGKWLKHHGIDMRPSGSGLAQRGIEPPSATELEQMIHVERMTYREVGERYGVDLTAVAYWLDRAGVARHQTWHERHNNPTDVAAMKALYESGLSMDEIGALYDGVTSLPVKTLFREHNIVPRPSGFKGGTRYQAKDGTLVRSVYEQRVADWLYEREISYIYEPRLPFSGLSDFLVNGWYIEIWGVDSEKYKARKAIKQAQYKAHRLPLIELPFYAFGRQRKGMWERRLAHCLVKPD